MNEDLELYIHIPFCIKKCSYCDFLSFRAEEELHEAYVRQLAGEIKYRSPEAEGYTVSSVFIGGGTPSYISEYLVADILAAVKGNYRLSENAEISIECNPSSVMRHKFAMYREAGVNRLSLGAQSADNAELKLLGRPHTFEEFLKAYQSARMEGFGNINVDLMNCFPMQSLKTWKKTLRTICMLKPEHISVYNLIIEEGTPFYDMKEKGLLIMPSEEEQAAIDSFTKECLGRYGYIRYEISNYAKPGYECRHNLGYWKGVPYIGFGLGASSYFEGYRWKNIENLEEYLSIDFGGDWGTSSGAGRRGGLEGKTDAPNMRAKRAGTDGKLQTGIERLSRTDLMEEFMYLGLRLTAGVSASAFKLKFAGSIENTYGEVLQKYEGMGLIIHEGDMYRLSERGLDVSNQVLADFLLH